jgi:PAS domain S-box-containing protein
MINTDGFFDHIYNNARENSVILMDDKGCIIQVNQSFIDTFGYNSEDLKGKHLRILFTSKDKRQKKPEKEIETALAEGSKSDNNYLVHKDGTPIWVMGESVKVKNTDGEQFIVKIIHNIHAQKQLEKFLLTSNEFIDTIFDSIKGTGLIILNSELKILKCNKAFLKIFQLKATPEDGCRLSKLDHGFWRKQDIRKSLMDLIVNKTALKNAIFSMTTEKGLERKISINSKFIEGEEMEKQILLVINLL